MGQTWKWNILPITTYHWSQLSHMATPNCRGCGGNSLVGYPQGKREKSGKQIATLCLMGNHLT